MPESQIAVLIDYENVGLSSIQSLFDQLSDLGRIIVKRAYADWSVASTSKNQALELGIEAVHYFHAASSGKNASDICLAIDAMELLHRSPVDTFVIVSSDTDFVPLVSKLRSAGKTVIGAGRRGVVSPALVRSCDRYIYLDDGKASAQGGVDLKKQAQALLLRAVEASVDNVGQVKAAKLHNTILRMDPSFDFRSLGYKTFTQFLASSPHIRLLRPRGQGDVMVELAVNHGRKAEVPRLVEVGDHWDTKIDSAWSRLNADSIPGSKAAGEAAKALGVEKLSATKFKTLQRLLDASELLRERWVREGNAIRRRS